jgi:hypothetical protein
MKRILLYAFHRVLPVVFVLTLCLIMTFVVACSFASFAAAAEADVPVVVQMISNITNLVAPGVSAAIVAAGGLALSALTILCGTPAIGAQKCDPTSLIGQYQATPSTTLLQKIQVALQTVNSHITDMLALAKGLSANVAAAIVAALGVALETVTALVGLIPAASNVLSTPSMRYSTAFKQQMSLVHSRRRIKKDFNDAISPLFPKAVVQ